MQQYNSHILDDDDDDDTFILEMISSTVARLNSTHMNVTLTL